MSYETCRAHIKGVLAAIAITSPVISSIAKVYDEPPETLEDLPCFIMFGSEGNTGWSLGGVSTDGMEEHTELCELVVHDAEYDQAAAIVRAFRTATVTAFQDDSGLGGAGQIMAFRWERMAPIEEANRNYVGQDFFITFTPKVS